MRLGINTFLFTGEFTNESTALFPRFSDWGFDSVEIALDNPAALDPVFVRDSLDRHQLVCGSVCGAMGPGRDLRGTPEDQQTAFHYIRDCIDIMPILGARVLAGPLYSAVGRANPESGDAYRQQWKTVVKHLRELGAYAEQKGVLLAIEPLNRYETDFINTCEQALNLLADANSPALRIHLDSYHMNIEEKFSEAAIRNAGNLLAHFHACGSDRGIPGNDHIEWDQITAALKLVGYGGDIVIESFTPDVKIIAKAASIWRNIESSQEAIAVEGLAFLQERFSAPG